MNLEMQFSNRSVLKKAHSHAKKHVRMFFYIFTYNKIFEHSL